MRLQLLHRPHEYLLLCLSALRRGIPIADQIMQIEIESFIKRCRVLFRDLRTRDKLKRAREPYDCRVVAVGQILYKRIANCEYGLIIRHLVLLVRLSVQPAAIENMSIVPNYVSSSVPYSCGSPIPWPSPKSASASPRRSGLSLKRLFVPILASSLT